MERRSVEASAKTVEEALEKALAELGVSREEAETEVINPGSRGLLGIGAENAVVRAAVAIPEPAPKQDVASVSEDAPEQERVAEFAEGVLRRLLREMGLHANVTEEQAEADPDDPDAPAVLNITGRDLGMLIGRRGETLRDLQFLTRLIVSRRTGSWPNLVVDVDHYRQRRKEVLTQLAFRMTQRVEESGQSVALEPMPAYERRIVHVALRDHSHVRTESTGEGDRRKVVIWPKG